MGCGASTHAAVQSPLRCIPGPGDMEDSSPQLYDIDKATPTPMLRVMTIGPTLARASWHLAGYEPENNPAPREQGDAAESMEPVLFVLQMEATMADQLLHGAEGSKGFTQIYAGSATQYDTEVEPGCSMRFRVRAAFDGMRVSAWSNEVSFVTQATVPSRPDAPCASCVGTEYSQHGLQVTWTCGKSGGLAVEQYDVQMNYAELISIPHSGDLSLDDADLDYTDDTLALRIVYSGSGLNCFIPMEDVRGVCGDNGVVSDLSAVRFRVQARNAMGYSQWSRWSEPAGGSGNPEGDGVESLLEVPSGHSSSAGEGMGPLACLPDMILSAGASGSPHLGPRFGGGRASTHLYFGAHEPSALPKSCAGGGRGAGGGGGAGEAGRGSEANRPSSSASLHLPSPTHSTSNQAMNLTPISSGRGSSSLTPGSTPPKELVRAMTQANINAPMLRFHRPHGVDTLLVTWEPLRASGVTPRDAATPSPGHSRANSVSSMASVSSKSLKGRNGASLEYGGGEVVVNYVLEVDKQLENSRETHTVYQGDKLQYQMIGLDPGATYSFRVKVQARVGPLPSARALKALDGTDTWCTTRWSPAAIVVTPATVPAKCQGLVVTARGPGSICLSWDACEANGSAIRTYVAQMAECPEGAGGGSGGRAGAGGQSVSGGGEEAWMEVYSGEGLSCEVSALSVGVCYKLRVRASNNMGTGSWSDFVLFTSHAVAPEAPRAAPELHNCLATSVDLSWQAPEDNNSGISSYAVQIQIDTSTEQSGANPAEADSAPSSVALLAPLHHIGQAHNGEDAAATLPPPHQPPGAPAESNVRLFTVGANTRMCTVGDLVVGQRYLFRVRACNDAGAGMWSDNVSYMPKAGPPVIRAAPELSSVQAGHVCVEWDGAEPNGSELIRYELERAQPEDQKGGAGGGGESRENKVESMLEAVEMYTIGAEQQVCHIKDLESNKRYQFRLRAVNGVGPSEWSDAVTMDLINPTDSDTAIDFAEIEMGDVIGEGGFSVVYRGVWRNRQVAVKRLKVQYTEGGEHHAEEFKREVELLSNLRHRNIVQYIGASLQSPDPCVLTELALYSLSDLLYKHNTKLKLEQTLSYAKDVAKGVKYLHALRPMIIHRDLKSSNLLIGDRNVLKISDFGLSRIKNESVTQISGMLGTPGWSAPEIYKQDKYTEKVDMYSYGVVMSEMVTGEKPYAGLNQMQIAFATVYQGQRPNLPDWIPKQLKGLIKSCWDSVPAKRPSWEKVLDTLSQMEDTLLEQRQARDGGSVRPLRLRAGHNRRVPPTPDAANGTGVGMGGSNATPVRMRPLASMRRPGSVEVSFPFSAEGASRGGSFRANSPTRPLALRMGGLGTPGIAGSPAAHTHTQAETLPGVRPARVRRNGSAVGNGAAKSGMDVTQWPFAPNNDEQTISGEEAKLESPDLDDEVPGEQDLQGRAVPDASRFSMRARGIDNTDGEGGVRGGLMAQLPPAEPLAQRRQSRSGLSSMEGGGVEAIRPYRPKSGINRKASSVERAPSGMGSWR